VTPANLWRPAKADRRFGLIFVASCFGQYVFTALISQLARKGLEAHLIATLLKVDRGYLYILITKINVLHKIQAPNLDNKKLTDRGQ
jgi:hypothetical protein